MWRSWAPRRTAADAKGVSRKIAGPLTAPLLVEDASQSELRTLPLVSGELRVRFLCAVPLASADGFVLGSLTVLDRIPRTLTAAERTALENLAALVVARLEARLQAPPVSAAALKSRRPGARDAQQRIEHLAREYERLNELLEEEIDLRRVTEEGLRIEK